MIWVASLAILKSVFGLHRRGWDACRLHQDHPIFRSFFADFSPTLSGGPFFLTFGAFYRFLSPF